MSGTSESVSQSENREQRKRCQEPGLPSGAQFKEAPKNLSKILSKDRIRMSCQAILEQRQKEPRGNIDHVSIYNFDLWFIMNFLC